MESMFIVVVVVVVVLVCALLCVKEKRKRCVWGSEEDMIMRPYSFMVQYRQKGNFKIHQKTSKRLYIQCPPPPPLRPPPPPLLLLFL